MRLEEKKYSPFCICQGSRWDTSRRTTYRLKSRRH
jgi:hypothetical protein